MQSGGQKSCFSSKSLTQNVIPVKEAFLDSTIKLTVFLLYILVFLFISFIVQVFLLMVPIFCFKKWDLRDQNKYIT